MITARGQGDRHNNRYIFCKKINKRKEKRDRADLKDPSILQILILSHYYCTFNISYF